MLLNSINFCLRLIQFFALLKVGFIALCASWKNYAPYLVNIFAEIVIYFFHVLKSLNFFTNLRGYVLTFFSAKNTMTLVLNEQWLLSSVGRAMDC